MTVLQKQVYPTRKIQLKVLGEITINKFILNSERERDDFALEWLNDVCFFFVSHYVLEQ